MSDLTNALRRELAKAADPARAPGMQAYMKSAMPYAGVSSPKLKTLGKQLIADHPLANERAWQSAVLRIWRDARVREERYFAIAVLLDKRYRDYLTFRSLPVVEELIVTGAWWDYVDVLASHAIGAILRREPQKMKKTLLAWSRGRDLWKRRSAIIAQLGFKHETDLELLEAVIEPSLASKEFFLRKGIGWALRQYAWTDPVWVRRYVRRNEKRLSPLSVREALKNVGPRVAFG